MKKIENLISYHEENTEERAKINELIDAITELQEAVKKLQEGICITTPFTSDGNKPYKITNTLVGKKYEKNKTHNFAPETQDDREEQPREEKAPLLTNWKEYVAAKEAKARLEGKIEGLEEAKIMFSKTTPYWMIDAEIDRLKAELDKLNQ